ncbi:MAG: L-threonylcarbamoyladenylate synthase [Mycoplasmataceae bacterium]|nr:L-threonylcarbamoyladenylate synthase [Mycoplasmataceae bacterium]
MEKTKNLLAIRKWLDKGGLVCFPTDTIPGLICKIAKPIYDIKNRSKEKKLIKFVNDINKIKTLSASNKKIIAKYWPGKLTIIIKGISYRCPNQPQLLLILKNYPYLYSSSANISNHQPIKNFSQAQQMFNNSHKILFANFRIKYGAPSTIIDLDKQIILRQGSIDGNKVLKQIKTK